MNDHGVDGESKNVKTFSLASLQALYSRFFSRPVFRKINLSLRQQNSEN